jgi:hypothetical protein
MKKVTEEEFKAFVYDRKNKLIDMGASHMSRPPVTLYKDKENNTRAKIVHYKMDNGQPNEFYIEETK